MTKVSECQWGRVNWVVRGTLTEEPTVGCHEGTGAKAGGTRLGHSRRDRNIAIENGMEMKIENAVRSSDSDPVC